ncbi:MAG: hypothetical protein HYZ11_01360 [Candidatus Tectomicrobia bacterium]|uniref:Uncharacterized protein n=1 Tax=Tectimicrobiota bacterium TaxID=2528274 RepID=A0A932MM69_UNCTE|nr:hypothetical protein [Candidatus Tectomicrobia bacterium]
MTNGQDDEEDQRENLERQFDLLHREYYGAESFYGTLESGYMVAQSFFFVSAATLLLFGKPLLVSILEAGLSFAAFWMSFFIRRIYRNNFLYSTSRGKVLDELARDVNYGFRARVEQLVSDSRTQRNWHWRGWPSRDWIPFIFLVFWSVVFGISVICVVVFSSPWVVKLLIVLREISKGV